MGTIHHGATGREKTIHPEWQSLLNVPVGEVNKVVSFYNSQQLLSKDLTHLLQWRQALEQTT